jgi:hypothetical protein
MKIGIILNGELRFKDKDHIDKFNKNIDDCNVYIITYKKYEKYVDLIKNVKYCFFCEDKNDIEVPTMYQWWNLQEILRKNINFFENSILFRLRTDVGIENININKFINENHSMNDFDNVIFSRTDLFFYSSTKNIMDLFYSYYNFLKDNYFKKKKYTINYENIIKSDFNAGKFTWINYPRKIFEEFIVTKWYGEVLNLDKETFKNIVHKNLIDLKKINNNSDFNDNDFINGGGNKLFASERFFACYTTQKFILKLSPIKTNGLYQNRKKFNYQL